MKAYVSCDFGDYTRVKAAPQMGPAFFFCDTEAKADEASNMGWTPVVVQFDDPSPRLSHKRVKLNTPEFLPDYPVTCWIDASMYPLPDLPSVWAYGPLACFSHPDRDDVEDEAAAIDGMNRYQVADPKDITRSYVAHGMPKHWGLWATGLMVRDWTDTKVRLVMSTWWHEVQRGTTHGQVHFPYACWQHGIRPTELPGSLHANPFMALGNHR